MYNTKNYGLYFTVLVLILLAISCNNSDATSDKEIVSNPEKMNKSAGVYIRQALESAVSGNGKVDDSIHLKLAEIVNIFYSNVNYQPVWSEKENWQNLADSLYQLINNAELEGLFPKDYHVKNIRALKSVLDTDSLKRMQPVFWAKADIMFTDAYMRIIKDLKYGRLKPDSITISKDSATTTDFFINHLSDLLLKKNFSQQLISLQPRHKGYWNLKNGIKRFLDSMDKHIYTYVTYPFKKGDSKDSVSFIKNLQKRLSESSVIITGEKLPDSAQLADAIKKYQKQKGLKQDGKLSSSLVRVMNVSDAERFKRIAITLDRYKQLPAKMPEKYIWVNIPEYYLRVFDKDSVVIESRIICGKPDTRTPLLNSVISDMITYPTWTVPNSIIVKQYLPKLKNNPGYLARLGLKLVNGKGETIDPYSINWAKYTKGIPYRVMQASGDNNALGIFKFNFNNPYAVYLHDTNQRYLFKNQSRAFSHGCVRVQEWEKLAYFIARNDSINLKVTDSLGYTTDSIKNWISQKEKRRIEVINKIPIYIRYFSCDGKDGKIKFYEDIYGEDKALREKYFADK